MRPFVRHCLPLLLVLILVPLAPGQNPADSGPLPEGRLPSSATRADQASFAASELFAQARSYEMLGHIEEAYTLYRHAWLKDPGNYRSLYHAGRLLEQIGRPVDAELAYRESARIAPDFYAASNALGLLMKQTGRFGEAEKAFALAAKASPDYAPAWRNLGRAKIDNGDLYGAVDPWIEAVKLAPRDVESRVTLGLLLARINEFAGAREHLEAALDYDPGNARAEQGLAFVDTQPGSVGEPPTDQLALPRRPEERGMRSSEDPVWVFTAPSIKLDDPEGLKRIGLDKVRRQEFEAAERALQRAAEHGGPDKAVLSALGFAKYRLGKPIDAAKAYGEAAEAANEPEAWLYINRGIAFLDAGKLSDATRSFGYAVKVDDEFARGWYGLGLARLERGHHRRALRALKQAVSLAPDDPDIQTALAVAHTRLGHESAAAAAYRRALIERPDDPELMMSLARMLEVQGRTTDAAEAYAVFVRETRGDKSYKEFREMALRKARLFQPELTISQPELFEESIVEPVDVYGSHENQ
ncbi:tetratricopeptide repeat protein [bacterium]|nr:tetratricopeptide repeat protein [bacterium]